MLTLRALKALRHNALSLSLVSSSGRFLKEDPAPDGLPATQCLCLFPPRPTEELKTQLGWGYEVVLMTQKQDRRLLPLFLFYPGLEQSQTEEGPQS